MSNHIRMLLERAIVRAMIQELDRAGFVPHYVDDGEDYVECHASAGAALGAIFAVDEARVHFRRKDDTSVKPRTHGVFLVGGNGEDIISDWHCGNPDFDAAVSKVAYNVEDLVVVDLRPFEYCPHATGPSAAGGEQCTRPGGHKEYHVTKGHKRF